MNKSIARIAGALLMLGSIGTSPCRADTIYSNLGPGNTWTVNREYDVNSDFMASPFVTSGGGNLLDVSLPLFSINNPVGLGLYTDSGGKPGTLLESWSVDVPGFPGILTTIPSVQNPLLSAATEYWFVIDVADDQKRNLAWYWNDQSVSGGVWFGNDLSGLIGAVPASPAPAIQLDSTAVTAVPEPASWISLASGVAIMAILGVIRRGHDRRIRS